MTTMDIDTSRGEAIQKKTYMVKLGSYEIEFIDFRRVTLKEHLQLLIVAINLGLTLFGTTFGPVILLFVFLYSNWWFLVPVYLIWIYYDRRTGFTGGRKLEWFRKLHLFKYYRDYFRARIIKTAELPPDNNYLLVMYPHGILPFGVVANFATAANEIETKIFPGIDMRFITLDINFYCPITREYFLSLGACGASESSIRHLLESEPSKAVLLLAGGASEAGLARPGSNYSIIINRRKGFVRVALKTGVPLVPVFSFGENNTYDQYNSKFLTMVQDICCRFTSIRPIIPKGRGFLQNSFGCLPKSTPITTVVGEPIPVPKIESPSKEIIDEYHSKFVQALQTLFENYKEKYDIAGNDAKLILL